MSIIIIIKLVIHVLFPKLDIGAKYEKMTNEIQYSERYTNETRKNIHTETEVFRAEATAPLHYETKRRGPRLLEKPT